MAAKKAQNQDQRVILIKFKDGSKQLVACPPHAKITFGPIAPGSRRGAYSTDVGFLALRIYNASDDQLGVFTNVRWFRDLALPVKSQKKIVVSKSSGEVVEDHNGSKQKNKDEYDVSFEWVSEDYSDDLDDFEYEKPF